MTFIQSLMTSGYLSEADAKKVLRRILNSNDDASYDGMLCDINQDISFASFQIKTVKFPVDQQKYIGFINTEADEPSKMGTHLTIPQREFFKAAIERMATAEPDDGKPYGSVSETMLLNLDLAGPSSTQAAGPSTQAAGGSRLSKQARQSTLMELLTAGWLASSPDKNGYYCIGVRSFLELGDYLLSLEVPEEVRSAWADLI